MARKINYLFKMIKSAYDNLLGLGLRSLLTALGIIIGTASVVALVSSGQMATEASLKNIRSLGINLISATFTQSNVIINKNSRPFTLNQSLQIKSANPAIEYLAPYMSIYSKATYKEKFFSPSIIASVKDLQDVLHLTMLTGRFISVYDKFELYCVIGYDLLNQLGLDQDAVIGKRIHIGSNIFTIVGVIAPWVVNGFFSANLNSAIVIPINTVVLFNQPIDITNMVIRFNDKAKIDEIESSLQDYANRNLIGRKLALHSPAAIILSAKKQNQIFNFFLGLIGSISLIVGGIGVMNTMLISVLERRQEIGIRLALGALPAEIQWMFLSEAIILSVMGGLVGILLGIIVAFIVAQVTDWPFLFLFWPPMAGFLVSLLTGIFFGYYPARKASRLSVIETLRIE